MTRSLTVCPLCEATCGLVVEDLDGAGRAVGDPDDVFSRGYLCPKGATLPALHADPDRLRSPLVRRGGRHVEVTWDEAFAELEERLLPVLAEDRQAVAVYFGNPTAHSLAVSLYLRPLVHCLHAYDLAFMPHGENLLLRLRDHVPVGAFMKDIGEEVAVMAPPDGLRVALPAEVQRIRGDFPDDVKASPAAKPIASLLFLLIAVSDTLSRSDLDLLAQLTTLLIEQGLSSSEYVSLMNDLEDVQKRIGSYAYLPWSLDVAESLAILPTPSDQARDARLRLFLQVLGQAAGFAHRLVSADLVSVDTLAKDYGVGAEAVSTLKREQEQLNQELLGMSGGFMRDVRDIEREIAKIKHPPAPKAAKPAAPAAAEFEAVATEGEKFEDPTPAMLLLATDVFSADIPTLWAVLKDRAVQYVSALTDRRYHGLSVDKDGHLTVEAPGRTLKGSELPGKDLDLVFLALRLTIIEKAAAHHKLPVVIEDTFHVVFDAPKQPLFGRMVKHLGSLTQVIHVGGAGHTASLADATVAI